ncbi:Hypothetical protein Minf_2063 [Methylacidiphilum infernorum V4]|uniref:Uncharacterized protein n=1 Tax=Methylacidiphilum infernorum (isolate V4) TaxID=481448 RepID=B3DZ25_METI4|nr:Hypothetical protein Minf_2063 [Methylacidiphilum infernorum V4]
MGSREKNIPMAAGRSVEKTAQNHGKAGIKKK